MVRASTAGWAAGVVAVMLVVLGLVLLLSRSGAGTAPSPADGARLTGLHVIPFPDTPDASPESDIIFSSLKPSDLRPGSPTVTGSRSGAHTGRLVVLPDGAGIAFVPAHRFTQGETVHVRASLNSPGAGTASGDPGAAQLGFSFTVAVRLPTPHGALSSAAQADRAITHSREPFRSEPNLHPPTVHVSSGPAPGRQDIFLSPNEVMILDPRGQLVWDRPIAHATANNLQVQHYRGRRVLTWWQGLIYDGYGLDGRDVIMDQSYRPIAVLRAGWGYSSDLHEFQITPQGTALVDAAVPVLANLRSVGGPAKAMMYDSVVQELDIRTGAVLWEWHALGHVPLRDSYWTYSRSGVYDPYHLNSIQQLPGHRLLISIRDTWAVYEIDELTGRITWRLGGKHSSFRMGRGTGFEWQHDARLSPHGRLTVFDDVGSPDQADHRPPQEAESSVKEMVIDNRTDSVSLAQRYVHSPPVLTKTQGSAQVLRDRDVFVDWGSSPDFSEYTARGRQVFDARFPGRVNTYRAYRFTWTGHPLTRPALAVRSAQGVVRVYASWNGDTQVASWRVLGGANPSSLTPLTSDARSGFETAISLPVGSGPYFAVQALGAGGHLLGTSRVYSLG